jgi:hypothetical protein
MSLVLKMIQPMLWSVECGEWRLVFIFVIKSAEVGKQIFFEVCKSAKFLYRKSANFIDAPVDKIANPQVFMINLQIANPHIATKKLKICIKTACS